MNKKLVATLIVGGVAIGTLQLSPTSASDDTGEGAQDRKTEISTSISTSKTEIKKDKESIRPSRKPLSEHPKISNLIKKYQISTEGKNDEEILNELVKGKAAEMGISTDGKDMPTIKMALLIEEAKKVGISTKGKSEEVLMKELAQTRKKTKPIEEELRRLKERSEQQNAKFQSFLKENGISSEGKSMEEIQMEILAAKAKEVGISTEGKSLKEIKSDLQSTLIKQKAKEVGISTEGKDETTIIKELREAEINKSKEDNAADNR